MMPTTPRFTLRAIFAFVAIVACSAALYRAQGVVPVSVCLTLFGGYWIATFLPLKVRAAFAIAAFVFASLPWFGIPGWSFATLGQTPRELPVLELPKTLIRPLTAIYYVAETPVYCLGEINRDFSDLVYFRGGMVTVRPFAVFLFWISFAIMIALSMAFSLSADRTNRTRGEVPSAQ